MRTIDTVLFDLDDTLHDDTHAFTSAAAEVAHEIAAEHSVDALALKAAYIAEAEGFWHRLTPRRTANAPARAARHRCGRRRSNASASATARSRSAAPTVTINTARNISPSFPARSSVLRGLRERGMKLGILTNGFSETHREKIALLQIGEYFDAIFIADEVGMVKPDPLLFAHACTTLGSAPARAAMVGDRYDRDVRGALDAGLYAIWLNMRGESVPAGVRAPNADLRLTSPKCRQRWSERESLVRSLLRNPHDRRSRASLAGQSPRRRSRNCS